MYNIRPIQKQDNEFILSVISAVGKEFGFYSVGNPKYESDMLDIYRAYSRIGHAYFVIAQESGEIVGGAGISPLSGEAPDSCELCKMYLLPEVRGKGLGKEILVTALGKAKQLGYKQCYIESNTKFERASKLYEKFGFRQVQKMGSLNHPESNQYLLKHLDEIS